MCVDTIMHYLSEPNIWLFVGTLQHYVGTVDKVKHPGAPEDEICL